MDEDLLLEGVRRRRRASLEQVRVCGVVDGDVRLRCDGHLRRAAHPEGEESHGDDE
jgi:hypothetical protein